jgi:hypothetical protein
MCEGRVDEGYWRVYVYSAEGIFLFVCGGTEEHTVGVLRNDIGGAEIGWDVRNESDVGYLTSFISFFDD